MIEPIKARANLNRETSELMFPFDEEKEERFKGEFYLKGGVCWPSIDSGFILLAGQDIATRKIHIFEQREFITIQNRIDSNGRIEFEGIAQWLNTCWSKYFATRFYWSQDSELGKPFCLEIYRSENIAPQPPLIEIPLPTGCDNGLILDCLRFKRLVFEDASKLHQALQVLRTDPKADLSPLKALTCCLGAYSKYPFTRHNVEEEEAY